MKAHRMLAVLGPIVFAIGCSQSDPGITTTVKTQLMADELVKARNINVDTRDGVVTLSGTVQSEREQYKAVEIARNTTGVASVVDNLIVNPSPEPGASPTTGRLGDTPLGSAAEAATDAGLTAKVRSSLLADPEVGGLRIDVDTRNGVVTLTGVVGNNADKTHALELAAKVENVLRVEDRLTVRPSPQ